MKIRVANDRTVFPSSIKIANQYESDTRTIDFDLSKVEFHGNAYLVLKYRASSEYFTPLLIGESMSIPVKTFMSAKEGTYDALIAISTVEISEDYDFSKDNPMFISNVFQVIVEDNFLSGTEQDWALTPAAQNYFDQLIALVEKVQSDLDSGAFVGNGIQSITKISTSGLVDTYQITFTNRSTFEYQVTNGQNGQTPTITIQDGYWYINGVNTGQQAQGEKGDKGEKGDTGDTGLKGDTGNPGQNATIAIGTVTTLEPDQEATVQNTGTETNAVLAFGIPKGAQGDIGPQGPQGAPGVNENVLHADIIKTENPSVDDAYEAPLQDLKFYGKSTQVSTTGKNLWDISKVTTKEKPNGTGIINNGDGTLTVTNSAGNSGVQSDQKLSDVCPGLQIGEIYTLSGSSSAENADIIYLFGVNIQWSFNTPKAITQDMLDSYVVFYAESGGSTDTVSNLQMEKGSTATPYEPYTGGKPSPSPDYPQEITKIEEVDCLITGANLYDPKQFPRFDNINGMTIYYDPEEDCYILNGTCTRTTAYRDYDFVLKATDSTYTITAEYVSGSFTIPSDKSFVWYVGKSSDGKTRANYLDTGNINYSISTNTAALDMPYLKSIWFYIGEGVVCKDLKVRCQLEAGAVRHEYEPYQSQHVQFTPPAPLYSLLDGSIADYVDVARGKYVYQLADVTFDGSEDENWKEDFVSSNVETIRFSIKVTLEAYATRPKGMCNNNTFYLYGLNTDLPNCGLSWYYFYYTISKSEIPNYSEISDFKEWLKTHNIVIVYQLATPTEQDIPAETLEALQALKTFNGVTNIFCNAPVSAQYEQSVQIVMNKILEQLNKLQTQTLNLQEEMINNNV